MKSNKGTKMKRHINDFTKRLDTIEIIEPWHRVDFFENLKSCHIETEESGQKLLVCDLIIHLDTNILMNDQEDADLHMKFFLEAKEICHDWSFKEVNKTLHESAELILKKSTTKNILVSFVYLAFEYNYQSIKGNTNTQTDTMIFHSFTKMQEFLINYDKKLH